MLLEAFFVFLAGPPVYVGKALYSHLCVKLHQNIMNSLDAYSLLLLNVVDVAVGEVDAVVVGFVGLEAVISRDENWVAP